MTLVGRVHACAARHGLWTADTPVLAAVSGGADSVALLLILHELAQQACLHLAGVAHLHHHIRGSAAEADAAFVKRLADRLGVPCEVAHVDVPALAREKRLSQEVTARRARLAFFDELVRAGGASTVVALAHTRTDQAETVLLRLARGAGPRGLAGMAPRSGHRVRPLLDESRGTLRDWLRHRGEEWRDDATNEDTAIARNHVRAAVMPLLRQLNPAVESALARAARIQRADADLLDNLAETEAARLLRPENGVVRFTFSEVARLPDALARRVIRHALLAVAPHRTPGWDDTEAVLRVSGPRLDLGRVRLELFGDLAVLSSRGHGSRAREVDPDLAVTLTLEVPGTVRHPAGWWEVEAAGPTTPTAAAPPAAAPAANPEAIAASQAEAPPGPTRVVVDAAALGRHLTIRGWQSGDRVQPLGLGGRKKLQDVFVDRKVPRDERPRVPVVVDALGRIVWVAGHVLGEPFRVTPGSVAVVVLTLRR